MRKKLLTTIGYSNRESTGPRSKPTFEKESQHFRIELRKNNFLNPSIFNTFESLDGNKLSDNMKLFSIKARARRIDYIDEKLKSKRSPGIFCPIPVTLEEEEKYSIERSMTKKELLTVIQTLLEPLNETDRSQFKGIKSKGKDDLLLILQQVKDICNGTDNIDVAEDTI